MQPPLTDLEAPVAAPAAAPRATGMRMGVSQVEHNHG
jgi:hypothetical protein